MKILHTSDLHLKEVTDNRWNALINLLNLAKEESIDLFIIAGDLFDKDVNAEELRPKIREILSNHTFKIIITPGNHDSESYKSGYYFGSDVIVLNDLENPYEIQDLRIWGIPFESIGEENVLEKLYSIKEKVSNDKKNILVYHGELIEAVFSRSDFGDEGDKRYMPVKLSYFKEFNFDYILAGHFHSRFEVWNIDENKFFIYPGSPVSITKKENGPRKVNIFELGDPPKEHSLNTPHYKKITIVFDPFSNANPLDHIRKEIQSLSSHEIPIITITGYINRKIIGCDESEFITQIEETIQGKCEDITYEFKDIATILEDELFKKFLIKLKLSEFDVDKRKQLFEMAIRAVMGVIT